MSGPHANGQPQNVEAAALVQIALTPEGKLLLNVEPPGLNPHVALGLLNRAAAVLALNLNNGPPPGPRITPAPPGVRF